MGRDGQLMSQYGQSPSCPRRPLKFSTVLSEILLFLKILNCINAIIMEHNVSREGRGRIPNRVGVTQMIRELKQIRP